MEKELARQAFLDRLSSPRQPTYEDEQAELERQIDSVLVTTETHLHSGVKQRLGIVTAEVAFGMNLFKDLFASVRNLVGGRSEAIQKTMRDSRDNVLFELKREAFEIGANAVIAVDIHYTQIGDAGWGMVLVVATGTAVVLVEEDEAPILPTPPEGSAL